jgi:DNA-binding HxlR family transcriptional regulator
MVRPPIPGRNGERHWNNHREQQLFDDEHRLESISSTVLSNSLEDLEDNGLVNRAIVSEKPFRVEYSLTEQGASLEPVIKAMDAWGEDFLEETPCN